MVGSLTFLSKRLTGESKTVRLARHHVSRTFCYLFLGTPLGTYLGWNVTGSGYFKGTECGFAGGYVPFAKTKAERMAAGDPRPSLEKRYGTHEKYVALVKTAFLVVFEDAIQAGWDAVDLLLESPSRERWHV